MSDLISRQAAIKEIIETYEYEFPTASGAFDEFATKIVPNVLKNLPSAQPEYRMDEWCTDCKEYDNERHCCPRFNHVIRTTLQEVKEEQVERKKGKWIGTEFDGYADGNPVFYEWQCSECGCIFEDEEPTYNFCPNCGARMEEQDEQS